jgi:hypothetical protein
MRREGVGFPLSDSVGEDGCMTEHNVGADNQKTSLTVLRRSHWARNSLAQADDLQSPIMLLFAVLAVLAVLAVYVYSLQVRTCPLVFCAPRNARNVMACCRNTFWQ